MSRSLFALIALAPLTACGVNAPIILGSPGDTGASIAAVVATTDTGTPSADSGNEDSVSGTDSGSPVEDSGGEVKETGDSVDSGTDTAWTEDTGDSAPVDSGGSDTGGDSADSGDTGTVDSGDSGSDTGGDSGKDTAWTADSGDTGSPAAEDSGVADTGGDTGFVDTGVVVTGDPTSVVLTFLNCDEDFSSEAEVSVMNVTHWDVSYWFSGTPVGSITGSPSELTYEQSDMEFGDSLRVNAYDEVSYLVYSASAAHCDALANGHACVADSNGMGGGDYLCEVAETVADEIEEASDEEADSGDTGDTGVLPADEDTGSEADTGGAITDTAGTDTAFSCADDADGDGYISEACGGTDCADEDSGMHPGAEDCHHDDGSYGAAACNGADDDCDGVNDY